MEITLRKDLDPDIDSYYQYQFTIYDEPYPIWDRHMEDGTNHVHRISGKDQVMERLKRGGCYEREKQRSKGKQESPTEKPQREEKDEEGEEEQVGWTVSMIW